MTLRTLNYGNYGIFLIMGNAGFCPSTVATFGMLLVWKIGPRSPGTSQVCHSKCLGLRVLRAFRVKVSGSWV